MEQKVNRTITLNLHFLDRYQMRPSYYIDFLQQIPQCQHGEATDVRETAPPVAKMRFSRSRYTALPYSFLTKNRRYIAERERVHLYE